MELFEKVKHSLRGKHEKLSQPIIAESFEDLKQILKKEAAGVVCIHPWKILRQVPEADRTHEYGLDYYSQSLSGRNIEFRERLGEFPSSQDLQLKNNVTAIKRTELIRDLLKIDSYVTTGSGYMAQALDPDGYPTFVEAAKNKGIEPFPPPIPQAIVESFD